MLLFLTRDARFKFSIEDLFAGDGDESRGAFSDPNRFGDAGSRPCQNERGDALLPELLNGEGSKGEEPF
jgi:hypothetical protein